MVRRVLPNGLTLLIQEEHTHPLVAFHALVKTGSATEGEYLGTGISHVLEHMLFKGTHRRPVGAVEREARSYGGTSQGFTTYDTTSYQLIVNREFWPQAADLLVDVLFSPRFDPAEFAKEREVVLRELRMRADDPDRLAWETLFANAYRVHPYRHPIIGYEPLVKKLTVEDAAQYHRRHYLPNTTVLAVVGDVDPQEVTRRIEELGGGIPPGREPLEALPEEPPPLAPREVAEEGDVNLGIAAIGFPGVRLGDPDLFALDLLASLLGGGRGSRLEEALKETGIVHTISCWSYTPQQPGLFGITLRADPEKIEEAVQGVKKELARAREELFPEQRMEEVKRAMLRDYLAGRQTVGTQASDLATYEALLGDPDFAQHYLEGISRTTLEDLRRAARRILEPQRATGVRILPRGGLELSRKHSVAAQVSHPATEKVTLENGLRVLLRPERRLPLVTLQVSFLGGVRYESQEENGLSSLTATLLTRGTAGRSAQEITDEVKRMGGHLETFSGRNSLGLTLEILPSELPAGLALLQELLLQPTFPPEELEKQRRLALANLKAQEEDPFPWGMRRLADTLFTRHPYRLHPSGNEPALRRLKREDLLRFQAQVLQPDRMVFSAVGDFSRQELLECLRELGRFRPKPFAVPVIPPEPPLTAPRERIEMTPRQEGLLLIGFPGLSVRDPRVIPLDVVEGILSGGAGRLFDQVRERRGLAYTVGATALDGVDPGSFILYALADPAQLIPVRQAMLEEIERLRAEPVPEKELQEVKQGLLGSRRIARQSQSVLAAEMASDELFGLGFDYAEKYDARLQAVTAEEIRQVARELLDPARSVVVVGRPDGEKPAGGKPEASQPAPAPEPEPVGREP